jgi:PAS domain S-box-containing protein
LNPGPWSERAIILAPTGRDNQIALMILKEGGSPAMSVTDLPSLCAQLKKGAGLAVIADEALQTSDITPLVSFLERQPPWSDLPIIILTQRGGTGRNPSAVRLANLLGNVTFLERPFHPITLLSVIRTAVRSRRRQYEARAHLDEMRQSEQRLQNALKAGNLGAWQLDVLDHHLDVSVSCKAHFGQSPSADFVYEDFLDSIHPGDRDMWQHKLDNSRHNGDDLLVELRNIWPDGSVHHVFVCARASYDRDGNITSLVGVTSDITERKRAEAELLQLNENLELQVEQRTAELHHNAEALRQAQKMEAVGQLTGGIAHDFNNMLTGIIGALDLMRRRIASGRSHDLGGLIDLGMSSANRAASLTHRLLAFSRQQTLDPKPVEINQLVISMQELLRRTLHENIDLSLDLEPGLWTAKADPNQLESALLNLIINARDAMPLGGKVQIISGNTRLDSDFTRAYDNLEPGEYVTLSVADNGMGMDESVIARAFDPFFTTKPIGQGSGLGLSMIYGFIKQSNGHVGIYSSVGKGTEVKLFLPRFIGDCEHETETDAGDPAEAKSGETVLVIEDDEAVRALVTAVLDEMGYAYMEAGDGNQALPILNSGQRIDLLISDVGLPGMDGRRIAELARKVRPELKVLFITGYAKHSALNDDFLEADTEVMTKPFSLDALTNKIRDMLG